MKIRKAPLSWMSILNLESHSLSLRVVWGGVDAKAENLITYQEDHPIPRTEIRNL